jgi:hypothetical protein
MKKYYLDSKQIILNGKMNYIPNDIVATKILSFGDLKKGWHFGEGDFIDQSVILKAIEIYSYGKENGFEAEAFPMIGGGINLSIYKNEHALDVVINTDLTIDLKHEEGIGANYETLIEKDNADYSDIYSFFTEIREACLSSESYQLNTTITEQGNGSKVLLLQTPRTEEYPLLMQTVLSKTPDLYAIT